MRWVDAQSTNYEQAPGPAAASFASLRDDARMSSTINDAYWQRQAQRTLWAELNEHFDPERLHPGHPLGKWTYYAYFAAIGQMLCCSADRQSEVVD